MKVARYHNILAHAVHGMVERKKHLLLCVERQTLATDSVEVWGDGAQTRSFMYVDECVEATLRLTRQDKFRGPVNIGSEEMVTINELAQMAINISGKNNIQIQNIYGETS